MEEKIRDFTDLIVWQKAHELFLDLVKDIENFPNNMVCRIISDQLIRSASSISANIAEGFGRRQGKEYLHYLIVARGSTTETINCLIKCKDLKFIQNDIFFKRQSMCKEILKMLNKMIIQQLNH